MLMRNHASCSVSGCDEVGCFDPMREEQVAGSEMETCGTCGVFACKECRDERYCCNEHIEGLNWTIKQLREALNTLPITLVGTLENIAELFEKDAPNELDIVHAEHYRRFANYVSNLYPKGDYSAWHCMPLGFARAMGSDSQ